MCGAELSCEALERLAAHMLLLKSLECLRWQTTVTEQLFVSAEDEVTAPNDGVVGMGRKHFNVS